MSTLNKISIQGIRSYHPDEKQTVVFQKPLTLILGDNGCGKTTIIECLKYATCSDQPKNTKNGGFVWDPKLSDHMTVKGQVKLYFNDTKNVSVVVSKTLESTQKLKNITTRSLDQTISINGSSASHKCADIDEIMCTHLGVSKPILRDVIFCHQEDSNWPLDEDKKLKEKFDSIFDVGKYDKCIDQIRKEIKGIKEDQKLSENNIHFKKGLRDEARSKRATIDEKKAKLEVLRSEIVKIDEKVIPLETRDRDISNIENQLSKQQGELICLEKQLIYIKEAQNNLQNEIIIEFKGSDLELDEELFNFNQNLLQKEEEKNKLEIIIATAYNKEKNTQEKLNKEEIKRGQYLNEEKQQANSIQNQNLNLSKLVQEMNIDLHDEITESNQKEAIAKLSDFLKNMNNSLELTKNQNSQVEHDIQLEMDKIREMKAKLEHEILLKEKQLKENQIEITNAKKAIDRVKSSANKLLTLKQESLNVDEKLENLYISLDVKRIKSEISVNYDEKLDLESKLKNVDEEVQTLQLLSVDQAELNTIKSNKCGIENKLTILKNKVNHVLTNLLGSIPKNNLKYEFNLALEKLTNTIKTNRKLVTEKQKQLTTLETSHKHKIENLRAKQKTLTDDENAMYEMCQGQEYELILKEVNEKVEELQALKGSVSTSEHLFKQYIKKLEAEKPCCPLCHRSFGTVDDVTELINDLSIRVQKIPDELENTVSQLETFLEKQTNLHELKPIYTRISLLSVTDIPNLKNEIVNIEVKMKNCREELSQLSENNSKLEVDESNTKAIQSDITLIDSYTNEISHLEKKEHQLENKLSITGFKKTLQEALSEQSSIRSLLYDTNKSLENNQNALAKYNEILHELQQKKNKITSEELDIKTQVQAEKGLMDKLVDLQTLKTSLRNELDVAINSIEPVKDNLNRCSKSLEQKKKKHILLIEEEGKKIKWLERKLDETISLQKIIDDYNENCNSQRIKDVEFIIAKLKEEIQYFIDEQLKYQKEIDFIKEFCTNQRAQKFDFENNKKLRNKLKEENKCIAEINNLKTKIGDNDINELLLEKKKIRQTLETFYSEKNFARGKKEEIDNIIQKISTELNNSAYKNAESNYLDELVQFEVLKKVENDLNKYWRALEYSLQLFHKDRMLSINAIIKELWSSIYNGNDIDYIEIKTSDDDYKQLTETSKRRTHNYRVVQWKNNIELDMRGRCSAGQKVLACLIIRMALAETFSKNCGILALDEPTTNLDEPNIVNLADSLSQIITRRSCQKSFQLIIITHDPQFLRKLSASDKVDKFYKVKRCRKRGMSIVSEEDIKLL
ncbi:DNA repair protein RAD50 [Daktulosphaira vitifoliae]|uniref:DNA repair protein RAD50 n=1 Tax=Daktulosphaira vitifoliae TaxID=58002 RepID=UPI0021AA281B|nr:DNA repair protein RAD50 [Daktulosphaira vitifoliae]